MFSLKVAYDDNSEKLIKELETLISNSYPLINLESFHENLFKEKKKALKLKSGYSARKCPFAVLLDIDKNVVKAFYSEDNKCTLDNIKKTLTKFIPYENTSN